MRDYIAGSIVGVIKGDTRSLDSSSEESSPGVEGEVGQGN